MNDKKVIEQMKKDHDRLHSTYKGRPVSRAVKSKKVKATPTDSNINELNKFFGI